MHEMRMMHGLIRTMAIILTVFVGAALLLAASSMLRPEDAFAASGQQMYRLYNPNSGEHFYTADINEKDHLVSVGWNYEGTAWNAPKEGDPVYRMYNENAGDHHYTLNANEKDHLVSVGWNYEGIGWYSDVNRTVPLYRVYNPNAIAGSHHYTTNAGERDNLVRIGWHDEEIGWYGCNLGSFSSSPKSEFEYTIGNFIAEKEVQTMSFEAFRNYEGIIDGVHKSITVEFCDEYGCGFGFGYLSSDDGHLGGQSGLKGYNCGYGAYITGYKGKSQNVVVPDRLNGVPVVYVSFEGADSNRTIDVSGCSSLRSLLCGSVKGIMFGKNPQLREIEVDGNYCEKLNMDNLSSLKSIQFYSRMPAWSAEGITPLKRLIAFDVPLSGTLDLGDDIEVLTISNEHGATPSSDLTFSGCGALKKVYVAGCRITSFDVSKSPNLKELSLESTYLTNTAELEAWGAVSGHALDLFKW